MSSKINWKDGDYVVIRQETYKMSYDGKYIRYFRLGRSHPTYTDDVYGRPMSEYLNEYPSLFFDSPLNNRPSTHLGEE